MARRTDENAERTKKDEKVGRKDKTVLRRKEYEKVKRGKEDKI